MNKKLIYSIISAAIISQTAPLAAMEQKNDVRYYNNTPINKETVLSSVVGPQASKNTYDKATEMVGQNLSDYKEITSLPSTLKKEAIIGLIKKYDEMPKANFTVDKKDYSIWFANPVNVVYTLWHGDAQTQGINIWDRDNRTDENFGKIKVDGVDSYQTISARACYLALLAAKGPKNGPKGAYVKVLPVYLHKFLTEDNKTTDASYVVIHRVAPTAVVLKDKPQVIASIPTEALTALYSMIMDDRSGAAGALWANENITVELNEKGEFKRWILGLYEKPNNQRPEIFFNQDKNFHENCQFEGLRTLAEVLNTSENKTSLETLHTLIKKDSSIPQRRFAKQIEDEFAKLLPSKQ